MCAGGENSPSRLYSTKESSVEKNKKKRKSGSWTTILLLIIFFVGLSLLLYPTVSNYWNATRQTKAIVAYTENVAAMSEEERDQYWQAAEEYNTELANGPVSFELSEQQRQKYENTLKLSDTGMMGYIDIPSIRVTLPIFHGTSDIVLQSAAGHLDWTSLPVGGASTHCVLSGHRGLPSATLFTHLDKLALGDVFMLRVLDEVLTYEVDQILTVEPENVQPLQIVPGEDSCTLVTCTPYGINTHRLLVRGHRVDTVEGMDVSRVTADAVEVEPLLVAPALAMPLILCMLIVVMMHGRKRKTTGRNKHE